MGVERLQWLLLGSEVFCQKKTGQMCSPVCEWLEDLIGGFGVFGKEDLAVGGI